MSKRGLVFAILIVAGAGGPAGLVRAQADADAPAINALATKQQMIRDRLARLEDRMFRLREKLQATEPENAQRLEEALKRSGNLELKARIDQLVEALKARGALDVPLAEQEKLLADLETLMGILLDRDPNDAQRREELRRLAEIKENLDHILREQLQHRHDAARRVQAQRLARRIAAAAEALRQLHSDQEDMARRTRADAEKPDHAPDPQAAESEARDQEALAERAERLQREIEQLARRQEELRAPAAEPKADSEKQDDGKPDSGKPEGGQDQDPAAKPTQPLDDAAQETAKGKQNMQQAAEQQRAGRSATAQEEQQEALENLRRAIHRLDEAREQLENEAESKQAAEAQRKTAEQTQKLAERMNPQSTPGEPGEGQDQPGENEPQKQPPAPGQENVQRAQQHMQDATEKLEAEDPEKAVLEQDQALDELERAKRELEETLKQLRKEEQEEILAGLESRLTEMLARQTAINQETVPLAELGADHFTRAETLKCAELAAREAEIGEAAGAAERLLVEDGTTVVFPKLFSQLGADVQVIADRLGGSQVDSLTIALQEDVRTTLAELLESLKRLREQMQQDEQQAGAAPSGGAGDAPLVPTSAELKLLKSAQLRINRQTQAAAQATDTGEAAKVLERAVTQQAELLAMTREIQERAEKGMEP